MLEVKAIVKNENGEIFFEEIDHKFRPSTLRRHSDTFEDLLNCVKDYLWCDESQVIGITYGEKGLWEKSFMKGEN